MRGRIREFIRSGMAGDPKSPAGWPLILSRAKRHLPGIYGATLASAVQDEAPDLFAAITRDHGAYDPAHRTKRGAPQGEAGR